MEYFFFAGHTQPRINNAPKKLLSYPKQGQDFFLAVFAVLNFKRDVVITPCFIFVNAQ